MKLNYWNPQVHEKLDKLADVFGVTTDIEIHKFMRNLTGQGIYERKRQYIEIHKFMRNLTLSNILPTSAPLLKSTSSWETWLSILKFRVFPSNWNPQVHEKLDRKNIIYLLTCNKFPSNEISLSFNLLHITD